MDQARRHVRGKPYTKGDPRTGRKHGSRNKATLEGRRLAQELLSSPEYGESLKRRLCDGELGAFEAQLWAYAFGPPKAAPDDAPSDAPADHGLIIVEADDYLTSNGHGD
jgi:hypothetical protein